MSEPISFIEQLRTWRQRKRSPARAVVDDGAEVTGTLVPFKRCDAGSRDQPQGDIPWLDWLRADPWVPVVED